MEIIDELLKELDLLTTRIKDYKSLGLGLNPKAIEDRVKIIKKLVEDLRGDIIKTQDILK